MTVNHEEHLERTLADLTVWPGRTPRLWKRALLKTKNDPASKTSPWTWLFQNRRLAGPIAACIVLASVGIGIAIHLPSQSRFGGIADNTIAQIDAYRTDYYPVTAHTPALMRSAAEEAPATASVSLENVNEAHPPDGGFAGGARTDVGRVTLGKGLSNQEVRRIAGGKMPEQIPAFSAGGEELEFAGSSAPQARQIIRKATIQLLSDDVRAGFNRAAMTINEGLGEYVQESSLTGTGATAQAEITLRVAASRLPAVMNALRELGRVQSEQVVGQDVTGQVVDLEARLRNEQRVEIELLALLEKRQDAPLKEILDLRTALANVRGQIEQLIAQRQRLGQLVSLSTVLVIIRTDETHSQTINFSVLGYFDQGIRTAWHNGLVFLADTMGGLLSVLIGGLIWWILLTIVITVVWRRRHRAA